MALEMMSGDQRANIETWFTANDLLSLATLADEIHWIRELAPVYTSKQRAAVFLGEYATYYFTHNHDPDFFGNMWVQVWVNLLEDAVTGGLEWSHVQNVLRGIADSRSWNTSDLDALVFRHANPSALQRLKDLNEAAMQTQNSQPFPPSVQPPGGARPLAEGKRYRSRSKRDKGCYVATAVYGSYDCPEVWVLRRFRDHTLMPHPLGRAAVRLYYVLSPRAVELGGRALRAVAAPVLSALVTVLRSRGVLDTAYSDPR